METAYIAARQQTLLTRLLESEHKFTAAAAVPEECARVRPAEGSWSVLEVAEHIVLSDRGRAEIARLMESSEEDLRTRLVLHPLMERDGYQLFWLIAAHGERHTRQIEAVKGSATYRAANRQATAS